MGSFWYYCLAVLFVLLALAALATNLFSLPGNWFIVGLTLLFALFVRQSAGEGMNWYCVATVVGLAVLGEVIELAAGAAGAAKSGGSRRGMVLAVVGAMIGSIAGTFLGVFIPV